jgi:hypothetical protein
MYQASDVPVATLSVAVSDVFPGREAEFAKQFYAKKGDLYDKWLDERRSRIREDLKRVRAQRAATIRI